MPRTLIAPKGNKRYVRRKAGKFTKSRMTLGARLLLTGAGRRERVPRRARETEAIKSAVALEGERAGSAIPGFAFWWGSLRTQNGASCP
jgi:hypothetical protein